MSGLNAFGAGAAAVYGLGQMGFTIIDDTDEHEVNAFAVVAVNGDAVFGAGCEVASGDAPDSGDEIPQGGAVFAPFTKIQLASGKVYAYRTVH